MSALLERSQYMYAEDVTPPGRKTRIVAVRSQSPRGALLGTIKWWGPWRQYTFMPVEGTVFNVGCLTDIQYAITELMHQRKKADGSSTTDGEK